MISCVYNLWPNNYSQTLDIFLIHSYNRALPIVHWMSCVHPDHFTFCTVSVVIAIIMYMSCLCHVYINLPWPRTTLQSFSVWSVELRFVQKQHWLVKDLKIWRINKLLLFLLHLSSEKYGTSHTCNSCEEHPWVFAEIALQLTSF